MKILALFAVLSLSLLLTPQTRADDDLDKATQEASVDLTDKSRRQEILKKDSKAKAADNFAASVTGGGAHQEELYAISAEILPEITKMADGDPAKMATLMQEAQKNPEAFYRKLPADKRKRIQELSKKIEASKKRP